MLLQLTNKQCLKWSNSAFCNIKLSRKNRALYSLTVNTSIKMKDEEILFLVIPTYMHEQKSRQRFKAVHGIRNFLVPISPIQWKWDEEINETLFNTTTRDVRVAKLYIVLDGRLLFHEVIWQRGANMSVYTLREPHPLY